MTRRNGFLLLGLLVALLLAGVVSGFASSSPDGLEKVAEDKGFSRTAEDSALADSPVADYAVDGVQNERLSTGLAGVLGVTVTFAFGLGLFALVRRKGPATPADRDDADAPTTS
ncbi:MAG TPA: PDGLE domain-containing protein [Mycobacteriales bacterium]|nr:PDGLE domain-containing protein [Mycobacteriales bacterium]